MEVLHARRALEHHARAHDARQLAALLVIPLTLRHHQSLSLGMRVPVQPRTGSRVGHRQRVGEGLVGLGEEREPDLAVVAGLRGVELGGEDGGLLRGHGRSGHARSGQEEGAGEGAEEAHIGKVGYRAAW